MDYARYMEPKLTEEGLNEVVQGCLYFIEVKADSRQITLVRDLGENLPLVHIDRQEMKQVFLNCC